MINISIIEDQRDMRESLVACLDHAPGLRCVGAHASGDRHVTQLKQEYLRPTGNASDRLSCHYIAADAVNGARSQDMADISAVRLPSDP